MKEPLKVYSGDAEKRRSLLDSFRDWLQKHSVQQLGTWLFFLGFIPMSIYWLITGGPDDRGYVHFLDYLLAFWCFVCWAIALTFYALKSIIPGIVTIYGIWAKFIAGFFAAVFWSLALLILYLGVQTLSSGG